jgi:hypothetical protein
MFEAELMQQLLMKIAIFESDPPFVGSLCDQNEMHTLLFD